MQLQIIFDQYVKLKVDAKTITESISDALKNSKMYQDKLQDLRQVKAELNMIKANIADDFKSELTKLDEIRTETEVNKMMTTDVALSMLMKGEAVDVEYEGVKYTAELTARFKKVK